MAHVKGFCGFCGRSRNDIIYGQLHRVKDVKCHYYCLLFAHFLDQNGSDEDGILGFLLQDIRNAIDCGRKLTCSYCGKAGAVSKCFHSKCKKRFHLPCGIEKGSLHLFFGDFRSFCNEHRLKQRVPPDVLNTRDVLCSICFETVEDLSSHDSLWAPCCKKNGWFHRICIQKFALSAAYFFKCPLCANQKKFRDAMLKNGIYIPDQDASWELEPNAFSELLERHSQCDAAVCKCPRGREYSSQNLRLWNLLLCQSCGSKGIHAGCIPGPRSSVENRSTWDCCECQVVMKNCSINKGEVLSISHVSECDEDEEVIVVDDDPGPENWLQKNESRVIAQGSVSPVPVSQDVKTVLSSAIHLTSSSAEVIDLVDDDEVMELMLSEDDDETQQDEKLHILMQPNSVYHPSSTVNNIAASHIKEQNGRPDSHVCQSTSSWLEKSRWSPLSHEVVFTSTPSHVTENGREPWSPARSPRGYSCTRRWKFQDCKSRRNLELSYCLTSPSKDACKDYHDSSHHIRLSPISPGKKKLLKIYKQRKCCIQCKRVVEMFKEKYYEHLFIDGWREIVNDMKDAWLSEPVHCGKSSSCEKLQRYPMSFSQFKEVNYRNVKFLKMHWLNTAKWVSVASGWLSALKWRQKTGNQCRVCLEIGTFKEEMFCDMKKRSICDDGRYEISVQKCRTGLVF